MQTDKEIVQAMIEDLDERGHGAGEVQNAPMEMLNIFLNDEGRMPSATVVVVYGLAKWGPNWEHEASGTPREIVDAILATVEEDA